MTRSWLRVSIANAGLALAGFLAAAIFHDSEWMLALLASGICSALMAIYALHRHSRDKS